jgi:hypothetical protein
MRTGETVFRFFWILDPEKDLSFWFNNLKSCPFLHTLTRGKYNPYDSRKKKWVGLPLFHSFT